MKRFFTLALLTALPSTASPQNCDGNGLGFAFIENTPASYGQAGVTLRFGSPFFPGGLAFLGFSDRTGPIVHPEFGLVFFLMRFPATPGPSGRQLQ